jgi:predicted HicB family RNase H-like nuclease
MGNRTEYKNQWMKENKDVKLLTLPKGRKAEIQAAADAAGETLNEYIVKAIDERMERLEGK